MSGAAAGCKPNFRTLEHLFDVPATIRLLECPVAPEWPPVAPLRLVDLYRPAFPRPPCSTTNQPRSEGGRGVRGVSSSHGGRSGYHETGHLHWDGHLHRPDHLHGHLDGFNNRDGHIIGHLDVPLHNPVHMVGDRPVDDLTWGGEVVPGGQTYAEIVSALNMPNKNAFAQLE